jgi:hypothetical protein
MFPKHICQYSIHYPFGQKAPYYTSMNRRVVFQFCRLITKIKVLKLCVTLGREYRIYHLHSMFMSGHFTDFLFYLASRFSIFSRDKAVRRGRCYVTTKFLKLAWLLYFCRVFPSCAGNISWAKVH